MACQLIGASPLLLMHDALEGLHEGDALAIMRAVHEYAKYGPLSACHQKLESTVCLHCCVCFALPWSGYAFDRLLALNERA